MSRNKTTLIVLLNTDDRRVIKHSCSDHLAAVGLQQHVSMCGAISNMNPFKTISIGTEVIIASWLHASFILTEDDADKFLSTHCRWDQDQRMWVQKDASIRTDSAGGPLLGANQTV